MALMKTAQEHRGFAANTLVRTHKGVLPIQEIVAGDLVLSQREAVGAQSYRQVLSVIVREDTPLLLVAYVIGNELKARHLVAAPDQSFWTRGAGWTPAKCMSGGEDVRLHDGVLAMVFMASPILRTSDPGIGWACRPEYEMGTAVSFQGNDIRIDAQETYNHSAFGDLGVVRQTVYTLEIEDAETYYVGGAGVSASVDG